MLCISIISNCIVILVNGGWTEWREWSACSISCGGGSQTRFRNCTNPIPANGGLNCSASAVDIRDCVNNGLCSAGKDALPDQFFWFVFISIINQHVNGQRNICPRNTFVSEPNKVYKAPLLLSTVMCRQRGCL